MIADALECARRGSARGGNQSVVSDRADNDSRVMSYDQVWVKHIKAALMENRFRLVQQPIASLQGEDPGMFDVLVRMVDSQGKEVLPSEFMAAADRNDLLKNIDRWVVGASLSFAAQKKPECLFVRLSKETARDASFIGVARQSSSLEPRRPAAAVLPDHRRQRRELRAAGHRARRRAAPARLPLRARGLRLRARQPGAARVDAARFREDRRHADPGPGRRPAAAAARACAGRRGSKRGVQTIGERVEDANTMAVLWQLGVQYIQGYFVHEPEEVVLRAER